jgi:hypothetical protein
MVIGFIAHFNTYNAWLRFTNHYHKQTTILPRRLVAASNGRRSPSSGFPNCPRPQLPKICLWTLSLSRLFFRLSTRTDHCLATGVFTEPFPSNDCLCWLHKSGFQQTCTIWFPRERQRRCRCHSLPANFSNKYIKTKKSSHSLDVNQDEKQCLTYAALETLHLLRERGCCNVTVTSSSQSYFSTRLWYSYAGGNLRHI